MKRECRKRLGRALASFARRQTRRGALKIALESLHSQAIHGLQGAILIGSNFMATDYNFGDQPTMIAQ